MRQKRSRRSQSLRQPETNRRRLRWLLQFAERAGSLAALHKAELEGLKSEVANFPRSMMTAGDRQDLSASAIGRLASKLSSAIRALRRNEPWPLRIDTITFYLDVKNGQPYRRYIASHTDGFLLEAQELIAAGARWLRDCRRLKCQRLFVANRRQIFCTPACAQDQRTARYLANHTPKELSDQRHVRYVNSVRRTKGAAVARKIRRRPAP